MKIEALQKCFLKALRLTVIKRNFYNYTNFYPSRKPA